MLALQIFNQKMPEKFTDVPSLAFLRNQSQNGRALK